MITKYKTEKHNYTITAVAVIRETTACLFVEHWRQGEEQRVAKASEYYKYHDSWEAAHAYLLGRARYELAAARDRVSSGERNLSYVQSMTPQGTAV